ncbi:catenin alpha-1-like [Phaenicophaeus curvirostris]|uniref:catenin alpha-1-like n=1 Tax=Phaenicophaeus curvirostris TaxID=33595 RepID=UPI0037F0CB8E
MYEITSVYRRADPAACSTFSQLKVHLEKLLENLPAIRRSEDTIYINTSLPEESPDSTQDSGFPQADSDLDPRDASEPWNCVREDRPVVAQEPPYSLSDGWMQGGKFTIIHQEQPVTMSPAPSVPGQDAMEPLYLHDLGLLTENKTIQRILCPMAVQLCHLILALEWEDGMCQAFPNLRENAEKLAKATEGFASVARRLAEESSDEVFKEEMRPAADSLILAGRCVLLAGCKLQVQPDNPSHREELAASAKRIVTETGKILQIRDTAGVRRITQAASWLLDCLSMLWDARDMPGLLAAFRAFSEALLLLSNLTMKHLEELGDCPRQRSLAQTLQLLQKCIPLLHGAKHSDIKHFQDQQVNLSKDYAFQLTERTIKELSSLLIHNTGSKEPQDKTGTFSQHMSKLLALLCHPDPAHLSDREFSVHVEVVIFYCLLLADSSRPDLKLDLVKHCWALLQMRKSICSRVSQQEGCPGQSWAESSLEKECHTMREEVEALDQAVLTATLCQILNTFFEGNGQAQGMV